LSKKTGAPKGILPGKTKKEKPQSDNLGVPRPNETPEERKARKKQIKELKRDQREKKKELKEAYKSEEKVLLTAMKAQPIKRSILHMT